MKSISLFTALLAFPLLMACQTGGSSGQTPATARLDLAQVYGQEWQLQSLKRDGQMVELVDGSSVTLQINADDKVAGRASVNRYFGTLTIGKSGELAWGDNFGTTMMAGPEPLMRQERDFLNSLGQTQKLQIQGDTLWLKSSDDTLVMQFASHAD
jgi:heat shock protein HslJ